MLGFVAMGTAPARAGFLNSDKLPEVCTYICMYVCVYWVVDDDRECVMSAGVGW